MKPKSVTSHLLRGSTFAVRSKKFSGNQGFKIRNFFKSLDLLGFNQRQLNGQWFNLIKILNARPRDIANCLNKLPELKRVKTDTCAVS